MSDILITTYVNVTTRQQRQVSKALQSQLSGSRSHCGCSGWLSGVIGSGQYWKRQHQCQWSSVWINKKTHKSLIKHWPDSLNQQNIPSNLRIVGGIPNECSIQKSSKPKLVVARCLPKDALVSWTVGQVRQFCYDGGYLFLFVGLCCYYGLWFSLSSV